MSLRIVAGRYRRRQLRANPGSVTRPITDRMKETLFNRLNGLEGARVADVFAGTGTMGLECLSRGAAAAVFFEYDRKAIELLKANVEAIADGDAAFCWRVDVTRTSFRPKGLDLHLPYSWVFFDPPYKLSSELAEGRTLGKSLARLARPHLTTESCTLVLRTPRELPLLLGPQWEETHQLLISSSRISICQKRSTEDPTSQNPGEVD